MIKLEHIYTNTSLLDVDEPEVIGFNPTINQLSHTPIDKDLSLSNTHNI